MKDNRAQTSELVALGEAPATWLGAVAAAYERVDRGVDARISGTAMEQLRSELALALRQDVEGLYVDGWALGLPDVLLRAIGDAAKWHEHKARQDSAADDAERAALRHLSTGSDLV